MSQSYVMYGCALFKNSCIHDTHNVVECPIVHGHTMSTQVICGVSIHAAHVQMSSLRPTLSAIT